MIALLIAWSSITFISVFFGWIFVKKIDSFFKLNNTYDFFDLFFIGLSIVGAISCYWSLVLPSNSVLFAVLLLVPMVYSIVNFRRVRAKLHSQYFNLSTWFNLPENSIWRVAFILVFLIVVLVSLHAPDVIGGVAAYDFGFYHFPSIMWNHDYRVVPGLSNLHYRFGFNSTSLLLNSVFSFDFLFAKQFLFPINSIATLVFLFNLLYKTIKYKNIIGIINLVIFLFIINETSYIFSAGTTSTDLLPNLLVLFIVLRLIENPWKEGRQNIVYLIVPLFAITCKLSVISIGLLCIMSLIEIYRSVPKKQFLYIPLILVLFILPWVARNVILTGYILYPFPGLDIIDVSWKEPIESVQTARDWIYSWARDSRLLPAEVFALSLSQWVPGWFAWQSLYTKILIFLSLLSPLFYLYYMLFAKTDKHHRMKVFVVFILSFLGFLLWFKTAPDVRFAFSFPLLLLVFPLILFAEYACYRFSKSASLCICLVFIVFSIVFLSSTFTSFIMPNISRDRVIHLIKKPEYFDASGRTFVVKSKINGVDFFGPGPEGVDRDKCYDKFPCTPYWNDNIEMRGKTLQEGFRIRK